MTRPTLREATMIWAKIGLLSFGGPAAQIALMHRFVVEEKGWLSDKQYVNALSFCLLLPGPEAMQLATYVGWRLHGVLGGLIAGLLFVIPGALVVLLLAMLYAFFGDLPVFQSLFLGIKAAVLVIVLDALLRLAKKNLTSSASWVIAALAFIALFFLNIPFPLVILTAGLYGIFFLQRQRPTEVMAQPLSSPWQSLKTIIIWGSLWVLPLIALRLFSPEDVLFEVALFFSKLAAVTFGGAYAVLSYMAQDAVQTKAWLTASEMVDGLGLAETTPGPLILVTEFVGFLAGARAGAEGLNLGLGIMAAIVTLWVTFIPCFLWVFTGAPYIDWIASKKRLSNALYAISAAVVGVMLNLSIWFAIQLLFKDVTQNSYGPIILWQPQWASLDGMAWLLAVMAGLLILRFHQSVIVTLGLCGITGWALAAINATLL